MALFVASFDSIAMTAGITGCLAVFGQWLLGKQQHRHVKEAKEDDNRRLDELEARKIKREDLVAAKAEEVALRAERTAALLLDANAAVTAASKRQAAQLEQIHGLVNSTLTLALQKELASLRISQQLLVEIVELKAELGRTVSELTRTMISTNTQQIELLESQLAYRAEQTKQAGMMLDKETLLAAKSLAHDANVAQHDEAVKSQSAYTDAVVASLGKIDVNTAATATNTGNPIEVLPVKP